MLVVHRPWALVFTTRQRVFVSRQARHDLQRFPFEMI